MADPGEASRRRAQALVVRGTAMFQFAVVISVLLLNAPAFVGWQRDYTSVVTAGVPDDTYNLCMDDAMVAIILSAPPQHTAMAFSEGAIAPQVSAWMLSSHASSIAAALNSLPTTR